MQCLRRQICVCIHVFFTVQIGRSGKRNKKIGTTVNAACQGNLSACHFGHVLHKYASHEERNGRIKEGEGRRCKMSWCRRWNSLRLVGVSDDLLLVRAFQTWCFARDIPNQTTWQWIPARNEKVKTPRMGWWHINTCVIPCLWHAFVWLLVQLRKDGMH